MSRAKKLSIIALSLLLVYGILLFGGKYLLQGMKITELINSKLEDALGRKVNIGTNPRLTLSWDLSPTLILTDCDIKSMFSAKSLQLRISPIPALWGRYEVRELILRKPVLYTQSLANGSAKTTSSKDDSNDSSLNLAIGKLLIESGTAVLSAKQTIKIPQLTLHNFEINADRIRAGDFGLEIGESDLNGNFSYEPNTLNLTAKLESRNFRLQDFSTGSNDKATSYQVPNLDIPVAKLAKAKIDVDIHAKSAAFGNLKLANLKFFARNKDSNLEFGLAPAATLADGKLAMLGNYKLDPKAPALKFNANTIDVGFGKLLESMFGESPVRNSKLKLDLKLDSNGVSVPKLVANARGHVLATAGAGEYVHSASSMPMLFANVLSNLITFNKQDNATGFSCGVANFKIQAGSAIANNGLALEAATVNVLGSGMVNFNNGAIEFKLTPKNLSSNPLDISQFSLAQGVSIGGTLTAPKVQYNPLNAATSAISSKVLSTVAGGGIAGALAQGLASKVVGETTQAVVPGKPCEVALGQ